MAGQNCSNCSAPLTLQAGEDIALCTYCGTSNRVRALARLQIKLAGGAAAGAGLGVFMAVGVALALGAVAVTFTIAFRTTPDPPTIAIPGLPEARPSAGVAPSLIADSGSLGWIRVAAPPFEGSWGAFDPAANLDWALAMGRAWSTDAQLGSVYLSGARADGGLDLSARDDWDVDYRMFSPALRESARQMATVSEEIVRSELRIKVSEGQVTALLSRNHRPTAEDPPVYAGRCGFAEVMRAAGAAGLEPRPTYDVILQHVSKGWRWAVSGKDIGSVIVRDAGCGGTP